MATKQYSIARAYMKFDGKEYRLFDMVKTRREALAEKKKLKNIGILVRIIGIKPGLWDIKYAVYKRQGP